MLTFSDSTKDFWDRTTRRRWCEHCQEGVGGQFNFMITMMMKVSVRMMMCLPTTQLEGDSTKPRPRSHVDNCSQLKSKFSPHYLIQYLCSCSFPIVFVVLFNSCPVMILFLSPQVIGRSYFLGYNSTELFLDTAVLTQYSAVLSTE